MAGSFPTARGLTLEAKTLRSREYRRWRTRFGSWVGEIGVSRIVLELGQCPDTAVTPNAVYRWLAGNTAPLPSRAQALVRMSQGELTLEAIYSHGQEMQKTG